jgi:hypothetical protein
MNWTSQNVLQMNSSKTDDFPALYTAHPFDEEKSKVCLYQRELHRKQ